LGEAQALIPGFKKALVGVEAFLAHPVTVLDGTLILYLPPDVPAFVPHLLPSTQHRAQPARSNLTAASSMTTEGVGFTADDGRMRETPEELNKLQSLLDSSLSDSTAHLRSIVEGRTITAAQLTGVLTGMCTLALSTVTAKGEPRISGADGHFLHGRWHFGTARNAAKARHLAARPAASVAHMRGEDLGVFTHGTVEELNPEDAETTSDWQELLAYLKDFYDDDAFDWNHEVVYYRLNPHWMTVYAPDLDKLTGT
jgi:Pyridoxamine 5'-phosphate oxidase